MKLHHEKTSRRPGSPIRKTSGRTKTEGARERGRRNRTVPRNGNEQQFAAPLKTAPAEFLAGRAGFQAVRTIPINDGDFRHEWLIGAEAGRQPVARLRAQSLPQSSAHSQNTSRLRKIQDFRKGLRHESNVILPQKQRKKAKKSNLCDWDTVPGLYSHRPQAILKSVDNSTLRTDNLSRIGSSGHAQPRATA